MMWQDFVFMVGSGLSILFLAPTLRDASARVPLGTSLPSMGIGMAYGFTFFTLGMTFSAAGALAAGSMWALIAALRSPKSPFRHLARTSSLSLLARDVRYWVGRQRGNHQIVDQYATTDRTNGQSN
ncbi:hypothetical protein CV102_04595 [Natronococcus pandeyae]|uniref:Uncharacterized protein n=1 Tax=Natronococcus pandeyae TaxID=2055836 RepID=A0A8J8TR51_9EURY|nr:hypothetical protein [Natronococcus pandeyae]TYL39576.1 hypothetical protein CV102_04595 [Natronococcus pandeyae]